MTLTLQPFGELVVHIDDTWNFSNGPISGRSCTSFREVVWDNDVFRARSVWANGSYQTGPEVAEPNIRVLFRTDDDTLVYLDYLVRVHLPTHVLPRRRARQVAGVAVGSARDRRVAPRPRVAQPHAGDRRRHPRPHREDPELRDVRAALAGRPRARHRRVMPETDFDVIVVGSGAAGLAAAATAAAPTARGCSSSSRRSAPAARAASPTRSCRPRARPSSARRAWTTRRDAMFEYYMTLNRWQVEPGLARAFCDDAPASSSGSAPSASSSARSSSPGTSRFPAAIPRWAWAKR